MASDCLISPKQRVRLANIREDLAAGRNPYEQKLKASSFRHKPTLHRAIPLAVREARWRSKVIVPKGGRIIHRFKQITAMSNPATLRCMKCGYDICAATATLGRVLAKIVKLTEEVNVLINNHLVETIEEKYVPKFKTGYVCSGCFRELWDDTYITKHGEVRRGITIIHEDSDYV